MCGISGFLGPAQHSASKLKNIVNTMTEQLHHRGPDGSGEWTDASTGIALGHRRLAILDLTEAGAQPMISHCKRFILTYNGEVYNFKNLSMELESLGYRFRGHSDTEVVLTAISHWGVEKTLPRLNGMFAMALWDKQKHSLTLARDPVGKKPLYYGWSGNTFIFASELKALKVFPGFEREIDRNALGLLIQYSWIPSPYCIYRGIQKLLPGSFLTLTSRDIHRPISPKQYWSARRVNEQGDQNPYTGSFQEATTHLDQLMRDAVQDRMVADVDVGALLSGGIDSTTIVALMQAQSPRPVKTFSIGFHEAQFNEAPFAQSIAQHLQTDHTELYVTAQDSLNIIPDLPSIYDEPIADPSQIPTFIVSKLAHQNVKVVLSGDGGDELFVGYQRYTKCLKEWKRINRSPLFYRQQTANAYRALGNGSWRLADILGGKHTLAFSSLHSIGKKWERKAKHFKATSATDLFAKKHARCENASDLVLHTEPGPTVMTNTQGWPNVSDPLQAMLYLDFAEYLTDDVLVKVDRASMAVSLEVRCPFLDVRVVDFAWSLPLPMRINQAGGKRIVKEILERHLPPKLIDRPKMGFGIPLNEWLKTSLRDWAEDLLAERTLCEQGFFRPKAVRRIWKQHQTGWKNHDIFLWSLLIFQSWYKEQV